MNRYIVKNCPAFNNYSGGCAIDGGECDFCTGCLIKQVIEKCKKIKECTADICTNPYEYALYCEARGVLQLFDIEEVSE